MPNHGTYSDEEEKSLIEFIKKMIAECEANGKTPAFGSNNFWQRAIDGGYCKKDRTPQSVRCWYYQKATRGEFLPAVHFQRAKITARKIKMKKEKQSLLNDHQLDFSTPNDYPSTSVSIESEPLFKPNSSSSEKNKSEFRRPWSEEEDLKLYEFVTSNSLKNVNPLFAGPKIWKMAINQGLFQNRTIGALRSRVHYHWPQIVSKYGGESLSTYSDSDPSFFDQSNSNINISSSGLVEYIYGRPSTSNDMDLFDISSDIKEEQLDNDIIIEDCNLPVTGISEVSIPSGPSSVAIMTHFDTPISAPTSRSGSEIAAPTSKSKHSPHELRKGLIKISQSDMFTMIQNKIHELQNSGKILQAEPLERISDVVFMTLKRASEGDQPAEVLVRKEAEYLLKTDRQKEVVDFVVVQPHVLCLIEEVHKHCC